MWIIWKLRIVIAMEHRLCSNWEYLWIIWGSIRELFGDIILFVSWLLWRLEICVITGKYLWRSWERRETFGDTNFRDYYGAMSCVIVGEGFLWIIWSEELCIVWRNFNVIREIIYYYLIRYYRMLTCLLSLLKLMYIILVYKI